MTTIWTVVGYSAINNGNILHFWIVGSYLDEDFAIEEYRQVQEITNFLNAHEFDEVCPPMRESFFDEFEHEDHEEIAEILSDRLTELDPNGELPQGQPDTGPPVRIGYQVLVNQIISPR